MGRLSLYIHFCSLSVSIYSTTNEYLERPQGQRCGVVNSTRRARRKGINRALEVDRNKRSGEEQKSNTRNKALDNDFVDTRTSLRGGCKKYRENDQFNGCFCEATRRESLVTPPHR